MLLNRIQLANHMPPENLIFPCTPHPTCLILLFAFCAPPTLHVIQGSVAWTVGSVVILNAVLVASVLNYVLTATWSSQGFEACGELSSC